jgi:hypothetical protein
MLGRWSGPASVPMVGVGSPSVAAGRKAWSLVRSSLCSLGRRGLSHYGGGPMGNGIGLVSPLFLWSAWAQSLWWRAEMLRRCSVLTSVPSVGEGSVTVVAGRNATALVISRVCSFCGRGLSNCGGEPIGKGFGLVTPLFLWSAWA